MNIKNIIVGISLILFGLSSCSEETAIDELNESTSEVQIILSSVPAITKAGSLETEKPTDFELKVQNCVLGIYDETDKKWVSTQFISSLTEDKDAIEHKTYKVASNLKLMNNHAYTVMVIANVDEDKKNTYESCLSFTDFESIKEGTEEYAFDASKLLKYGKIETFTVSSLNNRIEVPLDILAARIEFVINVKQTDVKFEETYYEMGTDLKLDIEKEYSVEEVLEEFEAAGLVRNEDIFPLENWNSLPAGVARPQSNELYYGDRPIISFQGNGPKGVYIRNYKAIRVDKYMGKTIEIDKIFIGNIRTQAIAVLPYEEKNMSNLLEYDKMDYNNTTRKYSFYTYAKGVKTKEPLQVSFSGRVVKKYILKKTAVTTDWFVFADVYNPKIWGSTGSEGIKMESGWKGSNTVFFTTMGNWKDDDSSIDIPDEESIGSELGSYNNSFSIKGKESEMIEFGHLYNVTATITDFTPQSTGTLNVSIQDYNTVTVPGFGFN